VLSELKKVEFSYRMEHILIVFIQLRCTSKRVHNYVNEVNTKKIYLYILLFEK